MSNKQFILIINCPDKAGIIASVSNFLFKRKFNILESSQYKDSKNNQFFMRVSFSGLENIKTITFKKLKSDFSIISKQYKMKFNFFEMSKNRMF